MAFTYLFKTELFCHGDLNAELMHTSIVLAQNFK